MLKDIVLSFPLMPVSSNKAYVNRPTKGARGRFLTKEAAKFKDDIARLIQPQIFKQGMLSFDPKTEYLQAVYLFARPNIITQKGSVAASRHDWDGFVKLPQDTITKCLGIDDSYILDAKVFKRHSESPMIKVALSVKKLAHLIDESVYFR